MRMTADMQVEKLKEAKALMIKLVSGAKVSPEESAMGMTGLDLVIQEIEYNEWADNLMNSDQRK